MWCHSIRIVQEWIRKLIGNDQSAAPEFQWTDLEEARCRYPSFSGIYWLDGKDKADEISDRVQEDEYTDLYGHHEDAEFFFYKTDLHARSANQFVRSLPWIWHGWSILVSILNIAYKFNICCWFVYVSRIIYHHINYSSKQICLCRYADK